MNLNFRELKHLCERLNPLIQGLFLERIYVPSRPQFPGGFVKNEWALRLSGRHGDGTMTISVRPQHVYMHWAEGKGPRASESGTRSPFDLALSKTVKGARVLALEAIPSERAAVLWLSDSSSTPHRPTRYGLALSTIPAQPEAFFIHDPNPSLGFVGRVFPLIARSRTDRSLEEGYQFPDGSRAPNAETLPLRSSLQQDSLASYFGEIEQALHKETFDERSKRLRIEVKAQAKYAESKIRENRTALEKAKLESPWRYYGDLLKAAMHENPPLVHGAREVLDYETGQRIQVPCDPKLALHQQVDKFYHLEKRKIRRLEEARQRLEVADELHLKSSRILVALDKLESTKDIHKLSELEVAAGLSATTTTAPATGKEKRHAWTGRSFLSKDQQLIWVGRNVDENLELTFKHAKGNDLWMHVRGRPGAHTVIPLSAGKSASLETLLDAAVLTVFYSNGENWGKTEVDYTFKKYVRRIKDSKEASYTQNKTLIVQPDQVRLKRLLVQGN